MLSLFMSMFLLGASTITGPVNTAPCRIEDAVAVPGQVWLMCEKERVFISSDAGASWRESRLPTSAKLSTLDVLDTRKSFIVGDQGTLLMSNDGGEVWRKILVPTEESLHDIHFAGDHGWIAGYGGTMLHSSDQGLTWKLQNTGTSTGILGVFFLDSRLGWAVGWNGAILRTTDGGNEWDQVRSPAAMWTLTSVYFRDAQNGWAIGRLGQLLRSRDGGMTWIAESTPTRTWLTSIFFDKDGRGWVTGEDAILTSDDHGETWRADKAGTWLFVRRMLAVNGSFWVVSPFGIQQRESADAQWRALPIS